MLVKPRDFLAPNLEVQRVKVVSRNTHTPPASPPWASPPLSPTRCRLNDRTPVQSPGLQERQVVLPIGSPLPRAATCEHLALRTPLHPPPPRSTATPQVPKRQLPSLPDRSPCPPPGAGAPAGGFPPFPAFPRARGERFRPPKRPGCAVSVRAFPASSASSPPALADRACRLERLAGSRLAVQCSTWNTRAGMARPSSVLGHAPNLTLGHAPEGRANATLVGRPTSVGESAPRVSWLLTWCLTARRAVW